MSASPSPREHLAAFTSFTPRMARAAWVGGIFLAAGLVGTAAWALSTSRLYRTEAVVLYEAGVQGAGGGGDAEGPHQVGLRLGDMLNARQRLEGIIKEFKLYPSILDQRGMVDAIDEMRRHLIVGVKEGHSFKVSYDGESRDQVKAILDRLLKGIIDDDLRRRNREAEDAKKFLDTERKSADDDLHTKESALAGFLALHPQLAAESAANAATAGGLIRAADRDRDPGGNPGGEIASLEMQAAQLEEALAGAGARPKAVPGEAPVDANLLAARARAQAEVQAAQRDLADKQARFTNEHPDVKAAIRRLANAETQLARAEAAETSAPRPAPLPGVPEAAPELDPDGAGRVGALRRALAAVRAQIGAVRGRAVTPRADVQRDGHSMVAIDTQWTSLMRGVGEARERQNQIEAKQFQADLFATLVSGGQAGRLVIADPPFRPTRPIAGSRSKIALVGGIASLALGVFAVLVMAAFDDRLYGARDVERLMSTAIVVAVPRAKGKSG